ncbi:MAG: hypothetical protein EP343_25545 [Deltaproteobacteria bacterium]|nr:MAG: hypothetical protein EP343_25545 [Deltaproteobacteria bacterium]
MNIKGRGNKALDLDLLGQLALKQQSGNTISKKEVQDVIADLKSDLQDEFSYSSRGLANAERAIGNTFKLALESGWVRGDSAARLIEEFVGTDDKAGSLDDLVTEIRADNRRSPSRTSYSSYRPTYTPSRTSWGT